MGFWIFMTLCALLLPVTLLIFGHLFLSHPPRDIHSFWGYRTPMSTKNSRTWNFAHAHCGKLWRRLGLLSFPITLLGMALAYGKNLDIIGNTAAILSMMQLIAMVISLLMTERALKENFTENGSPKYNDADI